MHLRTVCSIREVAWISSNYCGESGLCKMHACLVRKLPASSRINKHRFSVYTSLSPCLIGYYTLNSLPLMKNLLCSEKKKKFVALLKSVKILLCIERSLTVLRLPAWEYSQLYDDDVILPYFRSGSELSLGQDFKISLHLSTLKVTLEMKLSLWSVSKSNCKQMSHHTFSVNKI